MLGEPHLARPVGPHRIDRTGEVASLALLSDRDRRGRTAEAARAMGRIDAAEVVARGAMAGFRAQRLLIAPAEVMA